MKMKTVSMLLLAGSGSVFLTGPVFAQDVSDVLNQMCNGVESTGEASCGPDFAQAAEKSTEIYPNPEDLTQWLVYEGVSVKNMKIRNGQTGEFDGYRLSLVRNTGITGTSRVDAARAYEQAQNPEGSVESGCSIPAAGPIEGGEAAVGANPGSGEVYTSTPVTGTFTIGGE